METHVSNLGRLNVAYGIVSGLAALLILLFAGSPIEVYSFFDAQMLGVITATITVLNAALAIPSIVGGLALLRFHNWARIFMIVVSALNLLNPPVGTLLGVYGLWVLMMPEVEPLFLDTPVGLSRGRVKSPARKAHAAPKQPQPAPRIVPDPKRAID